ncbi:MAG: PAS domain S-box protein, partial [Nitrospirae bacterium]|nr:PAS domain S-box protein [Nitrospirota bacterium]
MLNLKKQTSQTSAAFELTKAILAESDFDKLLGKITEEITILLDATGCMLRLIEDGRLKVKAYHGFPDELKDAITVAVGEGIAGRAAERGETVIANNQDEFGVISPNIDITTAICTPLKIGDQVIGTLGVFDKKQETESGKEIISFDEDDAATIEGCASIAAIIIEKSRLYDDLLRHKMELSNAKSEAETVRDYLHGLVKNSADAIVTKDMDSRIQTWNQGAEDIYGYRADEVIGKEFSCAGEFQRDKERENVERVRNGETIKGFETSCRTKDGRLMDVSITMSPIKDSSSKIIGVSEIVRDISEKKKIERDIIRKTNELSRLLFISSAMRGTLDLNKLLRMALTVVTMGNGLGFNRAMLFLVDEKGGVLKGAMGVGPSSHDEAWEIWARLSTTQMDLHSLIDEIERKPLIKDSFLDRLCCNMEIPLDTDTIMTRAVKEKRAYNITNVHLEPLSDTIVIQQVGTIAYAAVPLISKDRAIGVIWVDNLFSERVITDYDMEYLKGFSDQISSGIESARLFEHVYEAEQELKNIFDSISDIVFISDRSLTIKKVNNALLSQLQRTEEEVIGMKCYEVMHGMPHPPVNCPNIKTMGTMSPCVEEIEEPDM